MSGRPVMLMVAPNGARHTKADHVNLPVTTNEIVETVLACDQAGASAMHLHVRDDQGGHSLDVDRYRQLLNAVKSAGGDDLMVQVTTEAAGKFSPEQQMATVMQLKPAFVSIAMSELLRGSNAEPKAVTFFRSMHLVGIAPQFICYSAADLKQLLDWQADGRLPYQNPFLLFVLGRYSTDRQAVPGELDEFLETLGDRPYPWAVCAFGRRESDCALYGMSRGGHVRIGFENNFHLRDGVLANDNAALVKEMSHLIRATGDSVMKKSQIKEFIQRIAR